VIIVRDYVDLDSVFDRLVEVYGHCPADAHKIMRLQFGADWEY